MTGRRLRVLLITPYPLFPVSSGGKVRIVELARNLSGHGLDVSVLTPFHFTQGRSLHESEPFRLRQVPYPFLVPYLFTDRPFPYEWLTSFHPGLHLLVRRLLRSHDVYQFEHAQFADLARWIPRDRLVTYDAHNVEYDYVQSGCTSRAVARLVAPRILRLERTLLARAAHVFACWEGDRERLQALYGVNARKISLAGNGLKAAPDGPPARRDAIVAKHPHLRRFARLAVYSGSDVPHNREAVRFIVDVLAPALREHCGFVIHGGCGHAVGGPAAANVAVDTSSDSFADYADPDAVGLNPVTQGSGSNLKLLHYLYHGLAVISTPFGMRGYDALSRFVTVVPRERFAETLRTGTLVRHPDPARLPIDYGWDSIAKGMAETYRALCPRGGPDAAGPRVSEDPGED